MQIVCLIGLNKLACFLIMKTFLLTILPVFTTKSTPRLRGITFFSASNNKLCFKNIPRDPLPTCIRRSDDSEQFTGSS